MSVGTSGALHSGGSKGVFYRCDQNQTVTITKDRHHLKVRAIAKCRWSWNAPTHSQTGNNTIFTPFNIEAGKIALMPFQEYPNLPFNRLGSGLKGSFSTVAYWRVRLWVTRKAPRDNLDRNRHHADKVEFHEASQFGELK